MSITDWAGEAEYKHELKITALQETRCRHVTEKSPLTDTK